MDPPLSVNRLTWGLTSPEFMEQSAVVVVTSAAPQVTHTKLGVRTEDQPWCGTLSDRRMGALVRGEECFTCGGSRDTCRGHFGVIRLATAVLPVHLAPTVRTALESVCLASETCPGVLQTHKTCPSCGVPKHTSVTMSKTHVVVQWPEKANRANLEVTMDRVARILKSKPASVWRALGVDHENAHPAWCVWTRLPVLPITARPYRAVSRGAGDKFMPDVTTKAYRKVILRNDAYLESQEDSELVRVSRAANLHDAVVQLISGAVQGRMPGERTTEGAKVLRRVAMLSSRALTTALVGGSSRRASAAEAQRSIASRLTGKTGRVRGHLLRNRCDQALRAVINGTDALDVDELGVPYDLARQVTKPVRAFHGNLAHVRELLKQRDVVPASARTMIAYRGTSHQTQKLRYKVERMDGTRVGFWLESDPEVALEERGYLVKRATISGEDVVVTDRNIGWVAAVLKPGDVLHRRLVDGDVVLFNRQPSLHAGSMMSMRVKVVMSTSLWMRDELAHSFNADHDGDEMNAFVIQTDLAEAEARELCGVRHNIMTTHPGLPNIAVMQNALVGSYLMTDESGGVRVDLETLADMLVRAGMGPEDVRWEWAAHSQEEWSGRDAFSHLFPRAFQWDEDGRVRVVDGRLVQGRLTKRHLGETTNGFVEHILKTHGRDEAMRFLNRVQPFVGVWLSRRGFTMRRDDLRVRSAEKRAEITEFVRSEVARVDAEAAQTTKDASGARMQLFWMNRSQAVFQRATKMTLDALEQENPENAALVMVRCGSKGKETNAVQMTACLGLQTLKGHMIRASTGRLLPHFSVEDDNRTLRSVGFATSNFSEGLSLQDTLVHARSGRAGVVDTAQQAPTAGHLSRKLRDALQEIRVEYDGTVRRTHTSEIVQYAYGGTGLDPETVWVRRSGGFSPFSERAVVSLVAPLCLRGGDPKAQESEVDEAFLRLFEACRSAPGRASLTQALEVVRARGIARADLCRVSDVLERALHRATIEAGSPVGTLAALGASHGAMQSTMSSFKVAGQMQAGKRELERIWEILRMPREQPDTLITLVADSESSAEKAAQKMSVRRVSFYTLCARILTSESETPTWETRFDAAYQGKPIARPANWILEFTLSSRRMARDGVGLRDIVRAVRAFAPWARVSHTNLKGHDDVAPSFRVRTPASRVSKYADAYRVSRNVCTGVTVRGVSCFRTNAVDVDRAKSEVKVLATPSESARALRYTWRFKGVRHALTKCTHVQTIYKVFGIQAARRAIVREMRDAIGGEVSLVHIGLLADALTRDGFPRAVHTPVESLSVMAVAAYDQQLKRFVSGAVHSASNAVKDVPSARAVGARVPLGTGTSFSLLMDVHALATHALEEEEEEEEEVWARPAAQEVEEEHQEDPFSPARAYDYDAAAGVEPAFSPLERVQEEQEPVAHGVLYSPSTPNYTPSGAPLPNAYSPSTPNYTPGGG